LVVRRGDVPRTRILHKPSAAATQVGRWAASGFAFCPQRIFSQYASVETLAFLASNLLTSPRDEVCESSGFASLAELDSLLGRAACAFLACCLAPANYGFLLNG
jgi:hypothetical protein